MWIFLVVAVLSVIYPLTFATIYRRDWGYFDSLSLFTKSAVFGYRNEGGPLLPIQDPWCAGGLNVLSNPQNRFFSPTIVLDLILHPYWANLGSLMIYAFLGSWGMYKVLRELEISKPAAVLTAILFINGSWFGLHFAEGHIAFGPMQLLPWVFWAYLRIEKRRAKLLMTGILALFLVDGAIYTFIFSILLMLSAFVAGLKNRRETLKGLLSDPLFTMSCGVALALTAVPKIFPVMYELGGRSPGTEYFEMSFRSILVSLFSPAQRLIFATPGSILNFHEFGCYLGIIPFAILISRWIKKPVLLKTDFKWILCAVFWLWVAVGWFPSFNPWLVFQKIPLINNAHVQSRLLLLMFFFYLVLVARELSGKDFSKRAMIVLFVFLCTESVFVRNFPFAIFRKSDHSNVFTTLIQSNRIEKTIGYIDKPDLYLTKNLGTKRCYEPALPFSTKVVPVEDPQYRGEIFTAQGQGQVELITYVPGHIVFTAKGPDEKLVTLNTNDLGSWRVMSPSAEIVSKRGDLLAIKVPGGDQVITLDFKPWYLPVCLFSFFFGIGLFSVLTWVAFRARQSH